MIFAIILIIIGVVQSVATLILCDRVGPYVTPFAFFSGLLAFGAGIHMLLVP